MPVLQPEVVGETFDGIKILKPVTEPTSFTTAEIRETIAQVMRAHYECIDAVARKPEDDAFESATAP